VEEIRAEAQNWLLEFRARELGMNLAVAHTVADRMLELLRPVCPAVFGSAGPKCVRLGRCPEGKMTCGRHAEMKARYAEPRQLGDARQA
ncbi:MAG: hypothetical protein ABIH17_02450, partial [Pseudomonadota bacterium]